MKRFSSILGAALLAASTTLFAQAPQGDADKSRGERRQHQRMDCSKAKDPKLCEERRAKIKAAHSQAAKACESQKGAEHRACMQKQMCAQAQDPAKCEAGVKARAEKRNSRRAEIREACKGKEGDALKSCIREQRGSRENKK